MDKDGACKMDRQNKKCNCARKSERRKNNVGTDKEEEKKLSGSLDKELPAEGCSRSNGKRGDVSRQKMMSDDRQHHDKWTVCISEVDMEKDGACKMDRQNKKCNCARKSVGRKNNAGTDKEEKNKLSGPLATKELPAEGCSIRNGKREEGSRQKNIAYGRQHYDKWTVCTYENERQRRG